MWTNLSTHDQNNSVTQVKDYVNSGLQSCAPDFFQDFLEKINALPKMPICIGYVYLYPFLIQGNSTVCHAAWI